MVIEDLVDSPAVVFDKLVTLRCKFAVSGELAGQICHPQSINSEVVHLVLGGNKLDRAPNLVLESLTEKQHNGVTGLGNA